MSYRAIRREPDFAWVDLTGPGLPMHYNRITVSEYDAQCVVYLLMKAFEAGRQDKAFELRRVLGVCER